MRSENAYVRHVAGGNLCIALGVMRFVHLQRSVWVHVADQVVVARCNLGKSKRNGSRGAFWWILTKKGFMDDHVGDSLVREHQRISGLVVGATGAHLLFDFGPKGSDVTEANHFLPGPLHYGKFLASSRKLLQCPPLEMSNQEALATSTYDGRKLLPSIAGLLHYESEERAALSNWRDLSSDPKAQKASANMGVRYDGTVLIQTAQAEAVAIKAVRIACSRAGSFDISLDELPNTLPEKNEMLHIKSSAGLGVTVTKSLEPCERGSSSASVFPIKPPAQMCAPDSISTVPHVTGGLVDNLASKPFSEEEASESDGGELEGMCAMFQNTVWIVPVASARGKEPKIHTVLDETSECYLTECNKKVGLSAERMVGWSTVLLSPHESCTACKKKLPDTLKESLDDCVG